MAITRKTWYGIARETTPLTPMSTPTMYMPKKGIVKFERAREYSTEERGTRDTNYQVQYTSRKGASDLKGQFYCDSDVYQLLGAFGAIASTQPDATHAPTVYKHLLTLADVPPSFTVFKGYDTQVYQCPGSYIEKLALKMNADGKTLEADSTMLGLYPIKYAGSALTPAFGNIKAMAGFASTLTFATSGITSIDVLDFALNYDQKLTPWFSASGSPDFSTMYVGERKATVDLTCRFDNTSAMDFFTAGSDENLIFDIKGSLISTYLATNYNQELQLTFPTVNFDTVDVDLGKDNVLVKIKATVRPSAASPLLSGFVQNSTASYAT